MSKTPSPEFKEHIKQNIIPSLKSMIEKEKSHLANLKKHDQSYSFIYEATLRSAMLLKHLEDKLEEYIEYSETI